jgi:stearoyl-CoA desaturase (delta-9 desaturase)
MYHGMGITVGYHRLLSHRAFKVPRWLEYFIVSGGYLALEGSPVAWVATHRVHHRYSDLEGDPHSPRDGAWHAFAGWLMKPKVSFTGEDIERTVPDLWRDPVYRFFDFNHTKNHAWVCLALNIAFRVALWVFFGPMVMVANLAGALWAFLGPFWVNSVCHIQEFGYRNFVTEDGSRNVWWVGLVALGEGWHNNHHAVPVSARHGMKPAELDLSWEFIRFLRAIGLAQEIRLPKGAKSMVVLDAALAAELNVPCAAESAVAVSELQTQLAAARAEMQQLATQLISACDALNQQMSDAKSEVASSVSQTKEQLSEQLAAANARLEQIRERMQVAAEQFAAEQLGPKLAAIGQDSET